MATGAIDPSQMLGPIAVASKLWSAIKGASLATYQQIPLPGPVKLASAVALAIISVTLQIAAELRRRKSVIQASEKCMDTGECDPYDEKVESTSAWKLRLVSNRLMQSNLLADKLSAPPPAGFTWGKTV